MIEVRNLTHRYGDRTALSNVSFEVRQGEIFGLLGPNGGGKSTLFRILSTMMAPTGGSASIAGKDVVRDSAAVRRSIGVVFQTQSLDKALTVEENLRAQGHLHGLSGANLSERMTWAMERLALTDRRKDLVGALSGGLRRRVEIAKALLHRPPVLLMDEASTGLDPAARRDLSRNIEELRDRDGVTSSVDYAYFGRSRPLRPSYPVARRKRSDEREPRRIARAHRRRRGGVGIGRSSCARRRASHSGSPYQPPRWMGMCASKSPTGIASSPKWWRRFPARSIRWACISPRWKMSS